MSGVATPNETGGPGVLFTWTYPTPQPSDFFTWRRNDPEGPAGAGTTTETELLLDAAEPGERICVEVVVNRQNGHQSDPRTGCGTAGTGTEPP